MSSSSSLLFFILTSFTSVLLYFCILSPKDEEADTIFVRGRIYTADPTLPYADSMAVRKGRILRIGSSAHVQVLAGQKTQIVDLGDKFVVPGFIDSHAHFIPGGLQMAQVDLQDARTPSDFIMKVKMTVQGMESGKWLLGAGWNNEIWGGELPRASWIDSISQDNPVWLGRMDGHMGLANSVALAKAGITKNTAIPKGGNIIKSEDGELTGILVDRAMELVMHHISNPSVDERRDALIQASKYALSKGVTTVVDFGRIIPGVSTTKVWDDYHEVYKWVDAVGNMSVRVSLFFPLETMQQVIETLQERGHVTSQWLHIGGLKAFADGSLGSSTALFYEPYADDPEKNGLEVGNPDWLLNSVTEADKFQIQVAVHAIGDAANDRTLSIFESVMTTNGQRDRRFRIEHSQHLSDGCPSLFGSLGIIASMQPQHLLHDALYAARKLGEDRALSGSYLLKSLLDNGAHLALGSDWPVVPLDPLEGIRAATERIPFGSNESWIPSERISHEAAIKGYTLSAAFAIFMDHEIGSLSPGKYADFVVLSGDLFNSNDESVVLATYVGGNIAYALD